VRIDEEGSPWDDNGLTTLRATGRCKVLQKNHLIFHLDFSKSPHFNLLVGYWQQLELQPLVYNKCQFVVEAWAMTRGHPRQQRRQQQQVGDVTGLNHKRVEVEVEGANRNHLKSKHYSSYLFKKNIFPPTCTTKTLNCS